MIKTGIMNFAVAAFMWVVDMSSLIRDTGRQIDFDYIASLQGANQYKRGAFQVKLAEAVDIGETAVTVDELPEALTRGDVLDFGTVASVVVTVGAAGASAAATSVPVDALSGPIPSGSVIHLGTNKFITTNAAAIAGATSLTTLAIPTALVDNDTGTYQGGNKVLVLAADALKGATAITVESPQYAIVDDSIAYATSRLYSGQNRDAIVIPESTICTEVNATTNRKIIPLALHPDGVGVTGAVMVLLTNAKSDSKTDSLTGYGVTYGGILNENYMADAINNGGTLPAGWKTLLGARYIWKIARDSRSS